MLQILERDKFTKNTKMKNIKTIIIIAMTTLILQSCQKDKIPFKEITGFVFEKKPKTLYYSSNFTGFDNDNHTGNISTDTDFMIVTNEYFFESMNDECLENNYSEIIKLPKIDFKNNFVFIVLHPRPNLKSGKYIDNIEVFKDANHNLQITTSVTENANTEISININTGTTYAPYQVGLYEIPKKGSKKVTALLSDSDKKPLIFNL